MKHDIDSLLHIMRRLRDPQDGCPWDVQQDFASIAPYTIEEAYEVADAIQRQDMPGLRDELGDLLLQVVFHARMAEEAGLFDFAGVVEAICDKMVRRHPHVFGDESVSGAEEQAEAWEETKRLERAAAGAHSVLDGIPRGMAELQRAEKLQKRAARVGFDWPEAAPVFEKIAEELEELRREIDAGSALRMEEELGDLQFAVVNLARKLGVDPARALRGANARFEARFRSVERAAGGDEKLQEMSLEDMDGLWEQAKRDSAEIAG